MFKTTLNFFEIKNENKIKSYIWTSLQRAKLNIAYVQWIIKREIKQNL